MILGTLIDSDRYADLSPLIQAGLLFLQRDDLAELPDGRVELDGDRLFAIVARGEGRGRAGSPLEYHRRYADIQYVVAGDDLFGWSAIHRCQRPSGPFDVDKDIGFFEDQPSVWCPLQAGYFALFFPEDAHAPLAGSGTTHKVVVKVAVQST